MLHDEPSERYVSGGHRRSRMSGTVVLNYICCIEELWKTSLLIPLEQIYCRVCKSEYLHESLLHFGKHWEVSEFYMLIIAIQQTRRETARGHDIRGRMAKTKSRDGFLLSYVFLCFIK